jgi:hypothetical protein
MQKDSKIHCPHDLRQDTGARCERESAFSELSARELAKLAVMDQYCKGTNYN